MDNAQSNVLAVRHALGRINLEDALPDPRMTAKRFVRIAMTELQTNAALARCAPRSILACLVESAQLGLMPGGVLGECYLVPFKGNATLIIGYKGLLKLVRRSGEINHVYAYAVFEGDKFKAYLGAKPNIVHTPDYGNPERESPDKLTHAYAVAVFRNGERQFVVMSRAEIESIRARSRAGKSGPWTTDYVEMALKTVVRRLSKLLPMTDLAARAVSLDEAADRGEQLAHAEASLTMIEETQEEAPAIDGQESPE